MIAAGHNNVTGLTNIEGVKVKGDYFDPVDDLGKWQDGSDTIGGDGLTYPQGSAATAWRGGALRLSHWWYLYTEILRGRRSNNVTIRTRRYQVPTEDSNMEYQYIIANAVLTLPPPPTSDYQVSYYNEFLWNFTSLAILEEDQMYGSLSVFEGSTAQAGVTTTPVLLTAFDTDGLSDGVTVANASDNMTVLAAGKWEVKANISFTGTASTTFLFRIRVDAAEQSIGGSDELDGNGKGGSVSFGDIFDLSVNEVLTIYVESDEGGGASITVTDAQFYCKRISSI
jgi:hypothetical protein